MATQQSSHIAETDSAESYVFNEYEHHDSIVHDIIASPPSWMVRWGISVIGIVFFIFLCLTWIIKYPDVISARFLLTSDPPPIHLHAPKTGRLTHLLIEHDAYVESGTFLAVIENMASYEDVLWVEGNVNQVMSGCDIHSPDISWPSNLKLGQIQPFYTEFLSNLMNYQFQLSRSEYHSLQATGLVEQIRILDSLQRKITNQILIQEQEVALLKNDFEIKKKLYDQGVVALLEKEKSELAFLQQQQALESLKSSQLNNLIQKQEVNRMGRGDRQLSEIELNQTYLTLIQSFGNLRNALSTWKEQNLLVSPISGTISMAKIWAPNQYLQAGDLVFSLIPSEKKIVGKVFLPTTGSGKVHIDQSVNIKLDAYPFEQHGILEGNIAFISLVPNKDQYIATIQVPQSLKTSFGIELKYMPEITGQADIITEDLRLIERIFINLRRVFSRKEPIKSGQGTAGNNLP